MGRPAGWTGAGLAAAAVVLLLAPSALAGQVPTPVTPVPAGALVAPAWSSYDTGRVTAVFPSTLPRVELFQDANASVSATLEVDQILELSPGGYPHPAAVAAAFPAAVSGFNGSSTANSSGPIRLSALLQVIPVNASLWAPSSVLTPIGPARGSATLALDYTLDANGSASAGVRLSWNVSGWPWISPGDLLAVEFGFSLVAGRSLAICSGTSPLDLTLGCAPPPTSPGAAAWSPLYSSVEGENGTAPVAALSWGPAANLTGGRSAAYTVGTYSPVPGTAEVALGAPANGSASVAGSARFALVAPPTLVPPSLLRGNALAYGVTAAGLGAAGFAGALAARRRDRRLRDEL